MILFTQSPLCPSEQYYVVGTYFVAVETDQDVSYEITVESWNVPGPAQSQVRGSEFGVGEVMKYLCARY